MTISLLKKANFLSLAYTIASTLISGIGVFVAVDIDNPAKAIVVTGVPNNYIVPPGSELDGVAKLMINRIDGDISCTGSLLPTGLHILTAAHCFTGPGTLGSFTTSNALTVFDLSTSQQQLPIPVAEFYIHPNWNGTYLESNDIAIIKLAQPAPSAANRYDIYRSTDEIGQIFTTVGYGLYGNGNTGARFSLPPGIKLFGQNTYDFVSSNILSYDFDNGLVANDAFGYLGIPNTGLGLNEVSTAPGDSGSPAFINGLIAGVTSFLAVPPVPSDIDNEFNQSFGELGFDTRVSSYASYIDSVLAGELTPTYKIPEPSTVFGTIFFTLATLAVNLRWKRKAE